MFKPQIEELESRNLLSAVPSIDVTGGKYAGHGGDSGCQQFVALVPKVGALIAIPGVNVEQPGGRQIADYGDPVQIVAVQASGGSITCDAITGVYSVAYQANGQVLVTQSSDEGQHWTPPVVVLDTAQPVGTGKTFGAAPLVLDVASGAVLNVGPVIQATWIQPEGLPAQPALTVSMAWPDSAGTMHAAETISRDGGASWDAANMLAVDAVFSGPYKTLWGT